MVLEYCCLELCLEKARLAGLLYDTSRLLEMEDDGRAGWWIGCYGMLARVGIVDVENQVFSMA